MPSFNRRVSTSMTKNEVGTTVKTIPEQQQLVRLVLANLLFSDQFYVDGKTTHQLVKELVAKVEPSFVANLAIAARSKFKLRHIPLVLARELARKSALTADTLNSVIQRADEMGDFLSLYWADGKTPISNQVKKGLAKAFGKFNEYQLAKYDRNSAAIRIRDVMFLTHVKPNSVEQAELFRKVADQQLKTPDTWETQLSAGADKKETFERLMAERKLGALAFLRNLRNMVQAGIDESMIRAYAKDLDASRVLPFRYIAAARIVPQFEDMLEDMMLRSLAACEKLPGKTKLYLDVSSSTFGVPVSAKSDLTRQDAILALGMLCREICEEVEIYSFSGHALRIPARRGFALADAIKNSQHCTGTSLSASLNQFADSKSDRIIVITDEQSHDRVRGPKAYGGDKGYILNVGTYQNGINSGEWETITGFSEASIDYIQALEKEFSI